MVQRQHRGGGAGTMKTTLVRRRHRWTLANLEGEMHHHKRKLYYLRLLPMENRSLVNLTLPIEFFSSVKKSVRW